jgi:N-acetylmuramoyl-L-alanine amidase
MNRVIATMSTVCTACLLLIACDDGSSAEDRAGADSDSDSDSDADSDSDGDTDTSDQLALYEPADGEHYYRLQPVGFSGYTPGPLEVVVDGEWPIGGAAEAGEFLFEYAFAGVGERAVAFLVDGDEELAITLNIDPNLASVCLDPGHPSSAGDKLYEAIINRKVGFYLEDLLRESGYDVLLTVDDITEEEIFAEDFDNEGTDEQSMLEIVTLGERTTLCNDWLADYFISIHHNAVDDPTPNYTLVLYGEDTSYHELFSGAEAWAQATTDYLFEAMEVTDGYARGDRTFLGFGLYVLQNTDMIGILTEGSFYSNPEERERLNDNEYLEGEAWAIFDGFADFVQ